MREEEERERGGQEKGSGAKSRGTSKEPRERRTKRPSEQRGQRQHVAKMAGFYRNQKLWEEKGSSGAGEASGSEGCVSVVLRVARTL